jgi:hypothetical protein
LEQGVQSVDRTTDCLAGDATIALFAAWALGVDIAPRPSVEILLAIVVFGLFALTAEELDAHCVGCIDMWRKIDCAEVFKVEC